MPIYRSDEHPDCYVECPGSGYALYVSPYGPCETGCDQERFARSVAQLIDEHGPGLRFSGQFSGVKGAVLAELALRTRNVAPGFDDGGRSRIEDLVTGRGEERFNASWGESSLQEFFAIVAAKVGRSDPGAGQSSQAA